MADEYGSESYRGSVDVTLFDTAGHEIHRSTSIQDAEIEAEAQGLKVHALLRWPGLAIQSLPASRDLSKMILLPSGVAAAEQNHMNRSILGKECTWIVLQ